VLARLSEVLFVETLQRYINGVPPDQIGWLAGARDPITGQALALLHKEPAHPWTVSNLARRVGLSRTRLAERFRHFLGESPMVLPGPMAAEAGCGDPSVDRGQCGGSRCGGGLWLRSCIQPRLQAGV
jgi:AraC-like DNA-binding protein